MDNTELESQLERRREQLEMLAAEADRRLADVNRRLDNAAARGSLLISAAAIATGTQVGNSGSAWVVGSVVASLIAAGVAIPLIRFSRGRELNIRELTTNIDDWTPARMKLEILNAKTALVAEGEKWVRRRSRLLFASLLALAFAIVFSLISVVTG